MPASFGGQPLLDPAVLFRECRDRGLPTDWFGKVNSFRCPLGEKPGTGFLLVRRSDLNKISFRAGETLTVTDDHGRSIPVKNLTVTKAECVTPGYDPDPNAAYLLTVADLRHLLAKVPCDKAYNLRGPAGGGRLPGSLNAGAAWTWQQIVTDLWNLLSAVFTDLPSAPTLPFTPDATPEDLDYYGGHAWHALNNVLARLACAIRYNPTKDPGTGTWAIVRLGTADAAATKAVTALAGERVWDAFPLDPVRAWRPQKVRVLFRRYPGPGDGSSPYWAETVTLAADSGTVAGTVVTLHDDLAALGAYGTPTNSGSTLATRAAERAADWLRERAATAPGGLSVFRGVRPELATVPGARYVEWAVEDRGENGGGPGGGLLTSVVARPDDDLERWDTPAVPAPRLLWVRITGNDGNTPGLYTGVRVYQSSAGVWADYSPAPETLTLKLARPPSNTTAHATSPTPPLIPVNQVVCVEADPDVSGYYRLVSAAGGLEEVAMKDGSCNDGYLIGRDLKFVPTVPPPPPATGSYYCVAGQLVYVPPGGTVPPRSDCGPSSVKIDCTTCAGTAVAASGGIGITDSTAYGDPYTVGGTQVLSLAKTGAFTGTPTWDIYAADPSSGEITASAHGTGNTFAPTIKFDAAGTVVFLVMLTDSGDATKLALSTSSRTVIPAAVAKVTANVSLDDTYLGRLIVVNASGGNVTLTLPTAASRARIGRFTIKRDPTDVSGNTVTVAVQTGENMNGVANGTRTVAAGVGYDFYSNDRDSWESL